MMGNNSAAELKSIVERITTLEEQKAEIASDVRDLYKEAKSSGFDPPALRAIVKRKLEDADKRSKREQREAIVESYIASLGSFIDTPLAQAAVARMKAAAQ